MDKNDIEKVKRDTIEDLQEAIVDAGGRFIKFAELNKLTLGALLETITPNGVRLRVWKGSKLGDENGQE